MWKLNKLSCYMGDREKNKLGKEGHNFVVLHLKRKLSSLLLENEYLRNYLKWSPWGGHILKWRFVRCCQSWLRTICSLSQSSKWHYPYSQVSLLATQGQQSYFGPWVWVPYNILYQGQFSEGGLYSGGCLLCDWFQDNKPSEGKLQLGADHQHCSCFSYLKAFQKSGVEVSSRKNQGWREPLI